MARLYDGMCVPPRQLRQQNFRHTNSTPQLRSLFYRGEIVGGRCDQGGLVAQNAGDHHDSFIRLLPLLLLDGFTDGGHRFDGVAGVETWRVELVLEPGPIREALGVGELALALDQWVVYSGERSGSEPRAAIPVGLLECFAVFCRA